MDRVILHSDLNSFYASVECLYNPEIRNKPVAVCGDPASRHGIILAKNQLAKKYKIGTADTVYEAMTKCPELVLVRADYSRYLKISKLIKNIYCEYSSMTESFGIDESWLDVTDSVKIFGDGEKIANEIRARIFNEYGITASIGVSFNKIFAKLGSDYKKPDATTVISRANYRDIVWPLPVSDLLYVGRATDAKLKRLSIRTIGELANTNCEFLRRNFGKVGLMLHKFANGNDDSPVAYTDHDSGVKTIGNSITAPRDLVNIGEVKAMLYMLSDSVSERLRAHELKCDAIQISVKTTDFKQVERQGILSAPTNVSSEIANKAFEIFNTKCNMDIPIRALGVRAINLSAEHEPIQLSFESDIKKRLRLEQIEEVTDDIRRRFGYHTIKRGVLLEDEELTHANTREEHVIHPISFF